MDVGIDGIASSSKATRANLRASSAMRSLQCWTGDPRLPSLMQYAFLCVILTLLPIGNGRHVINHRDGF